MYAYDGQGNELTETLYPNAADAQNQTGATDVISYTYDADGDLLSEGDQYSTITYAYDGDGDTTNVSTVAGPSLSGLPGVALVSQFDANGDRTQLSATIGLTNDFQDTFGYDGDGNMSSVTQSSAGGNAVASKTVGFTYDADGDVKMVSRYVAATQSGPDVAQSTYAYDGDGNLTSLSHALYNWNTLSYSWVYDADGNITSSTSQDGSANYTYDGEGELESAQYTPLSGHTMPANVTYGYDPNGNRSALNSTPCSTSVDNELLSDGTFTYSYDNEGNLVTRTRISTAPANDYQTTYTWDNRDRLTSVTYQNNSGQTTQTVKYYYDPENRLIGETVTPYANGVAQTATTTYYTYDGDEIVLAFSQTGTGTLALSHRELWGPAVDQLLADEQVNSASQQGTVVWPLPDNEGTACDLAEYNAATGTTTVLDHRVFDAFGNLVHESNPTATAAVDFLFRQAGELFDTATGLENDLNRWYDPTTGRYLSRDPSGFAGGDPNLYRCDGNNHLANSDPTGLDFGDPGLGDPGLGDPGLGDPGLGDPGLGDPGLGDPGLGGGDPFVGADPGDPFVAGDAGGNGGSSDMGGEYGIDSSPDVVDALGTALGSLGNAVGDVASSWAAPYLGAPMFAGGASASDQLGWLNANYSGSDWWNAAANMAINDWNYVADTSALGSLGNALWDTVSPLAAPVLNAAMFAGGTSINDQLAWLNANYSGSEWWSQAANVAVNDWNYAGSQYGPSNPQPPAGVWPASLVLSNIQATAAPSGPLGLGGGTQQLPDLPPLRAEDLIQPAPLASSPVGPYGPFAPGWAVGKWGVPSATPTPNVQLDAGSGLPIDATSNQVALWANVNSANTTTGTTGFNGAAPVSPGYSANAHFIGSVANQLQQLASVRRKKRGLPCFVEQTGDTWRPKIGGEEESGWFTELETT